MFGRHESCSWKTVSECAGTLAWLFRRYAWPHSFSSKTGLCSSREARAELPSCRSPLGATWSGFAFTALQLGAAKLSFASQMSFRSLLFFTRATNSLFSFSFSFIRTPPPPPPTKLETFLDDVLFHLLAAHQHHRLVPGTHTSVACFPFVSLFDVTRTRPARLSTWNKSSMD